MPPPAGVEGSRHTVITQGGMSMARSGKENQGKGRVKGVLELVGLGDQARPGLTLEAVDPSGKRKAIPLSASGEFHLDEALTGKGYALELRAGEGGEARRF